MVGMGGVLSSRRGHASTRCCLPGQTASGSASRLAGSPAQGTGFVGRPASGRYAVSPSDSDHPRGGRGSGGLLPCGQERRGEAGSHRGLAAGAADGMAKTYAAMGILDIVSGPEGAGGMADERYRPKTFILRDGMKVGFHRASGSNGGPGFPVMTISCDPSSCGSMSTPADASSSTRGVRSSRWPRPCAPLPSGRGCPTRSASTMSATSGSRPCSTLERRPPPWPRWLARV